MPLANCARCKRMFNKTSSPVCTQCETAEEADCEKVRELINREPNLNAEELAEKAEVDIRVVNRMVNEGQLTCASVTVDVTCGRCGAPAISMSKKLCQACLDKLNAEVARAQSSIKLSAKKDVQVGEYNMNVHKTLDLKRKP